MFDHRPKIPCAARITSHALRFRHLELDWPGFFTALLHLYRRDRPSSIVPPDGDSQTVKLIEPNALDRAGFSVAENHRFSDEFGLHVSERGEDRGGAMLHKGHDVPQSQAGERFGAVVLHSKGVEVVAGTGQRSVG